MGYWNSVMLVIKYADAVLFVLDARMPELSNNKDLDDKLKDSGKEILRVFNKVDLVDTERVSKLRKEYPGAFFVSSSEKTGIANLRISLLKIAKKMKVEKLEVGVVGYPNVGKSALINILSRAAKTIVSSKAGTTKGIQWASSTKFKMIDSPGVIPFDDDEVRLGMLGAKNAEKLNDVEGVAVKIINIFLENDISDLEKRYGFNSGGEKDEHEILIKIGKARKLLMRGGVVDENRVSMMLVRDWQQGKLRLGRFKRADSDSIL